MKNSNLQRKRVILPLLVGLLLALACGLYNAQYALNNQVRLAIYRYERKTHGPVDDLVVHFNRDEPRVKFEGQNENGGRTVWLYSLGAREYFDLRPPERSYLYIREIQYNGDRTQATAQIYRGDGTGYQGRELTLTQTENNGWAVTAERDLPPP